MTDPRASTARVAGDGFLRLAGRSFRAAIGERGIVACKEEGDRGTPRGILPLRRVLFRADRVAAPRCAVPIEPIAPDDGWCDDPAHPDYNRMVRLPHPARHEELWRADGLYDVVGVLGWNDESPVRGAGSAIFLHVARGDYAPTEGCIALALPDLLEALGRGLAAVMVS